jgi:hypothetical protein
MRAQRARSVDNRRRADDLDRQGRVIAVTLRSGSLRLQRVGCLRRCARRRLRGGGCALRAALTLL